MKPTLIFGIVFALSVIMVALFIALDIPNYQEAPFPLKVGTWLMCAGLIYLAGLKIVEEIKKYLDL